MMEKVLSVDQLPRAQQGPVTILLPTCHLARALSCPACHYTQDIDAGHIWHNQPAPPIAQAYWRLPADATMRDLILAVRADEACHSHVNHTFAALPQDEVNPFTGKGADVMP